MKFEFVTLDVFTEQKFSGNQLAIVRVPTTLRDHLSEEQKQKIASEFNLSETVFLHDVSEDDEVANYDIFTIEARINFAGHPTIGTAIYVSHHARDNYPQVTTLHTLAGHIPVAYDPSTTAASVAIPHNVRIHGTRLAHPLPSAFSHDQPTVPLVSIVKGMTFVLVPMPRLDALGSLTHGVLPPGTAYSSTHLLDADDSFNVGFVGTFYYYPLGLDPDAPAGVEVRLIRTRMFDAVEDPGTGSASAALCAFISLFKEKEKGKGPFEFHLVQGVEMGRRCDIFVQVERSEDGTAIESVRLKRSAVKVMEGRIEVDTVEGP